MNLYAASYRNRRVLVTGHTGFKGSWLCEWLLQVGAEVSGFSLAPPSNPSLFQQLELGKRMHHREGDVCDLAALRDWVRETRPEYVFHLAAQPLVRHSYQEPVRTFAVNVLGTVHLLESLRTLEHPCTALVVTTDKCYANREWLYGYREEDRLGGRDPYSASKAAAEIAAAAYRASFLSGGQVRVATARAGNVIGGGDWAEDRIVPDCIRALRRKEGVGVRHPGAVRPWQHVLDPLNGYLLLAARLRASEEPDLPELASAFNFGPAYGDHRTVAALVTELLRHWPGTWQPERSSGAVHEAQFLHLNTDKAHALLQWRPVWNFEESVARTAAWYLEAEARPGDVRQITRGQLEAFAQDAARAGQREAP